MTRSSGFRPCIVCGETEKINVYCQYNSLDYARCEQCGLIYVNRFATDEEMKTAYTGGNFKSFRRKILGPFRKMKSIKGHVHFQKRANKIYQFAKEKLGEQAPFAILDIGCNKGFILSSAAADENNVFGIELVSELMIPFKNTFPQFASNIFSDKFSSVAEKFDAGFFKIITAIDVIEHFEDPVNDLTQIHRILSPHGVFLIQTPDTACAEASQQKCKWGGLKPLEHLHLFNGRNFSDLCKSIGFSEVTIHEPFDYADGNFVAVLKK